MHSTLEAKSFSAKYVIAELLGQGLHSSVYKCYSTLDQERQHPLAVKISRDDDEEKRAAFQREYDLLSQLSHPNVISSIEKFDNELTNETHMVMKYVPGHDLI